jgi:hypothetical protein
MHVENGLRGIGAMPTLARADQSVPPSLPR